MSEDQTQPTLAVVMVVAPLFELGMLVATPGALEALAEAEKEPMEYLARHATGDWGDLDDEDKVSNDRAVTSDERLLSAYAVTSTIKIWIITEYDRSVTTILLPSEY